MKPTAIENWLKKNFNELFEEQLHNWYIDETMWPQKRTFNMFKEWFSYSLHTMIFDTQKGFIEKIWQAISRVFATNIFQAHVSSCWLA